MLRLWPFGTQWWLTPKTKPIAHMCYRIKFGISATKGVHINIRESPKIGEHWGSATLQWGCSWSTEILHRTGKHCGNDHLELCVFILTPTSARPNDHRWLGWPVLAVLCGPDCCSQNTDTNALMSFFHWCGSSSGRVLHDSTRPVTGCCWVTDAAHWWPTQSWLIMPVHTERVDVHHHASTRV